MMFDTLTYREQDIPRVSNYFNIPADLDGYCFDYQHITNFLKDLRIKLDRAGYDVKDNLRYFYSTEYGEHNTHRSHIHLLFFVKNDFIEPDELSKYISDCWKYGRTDGVPYRSHYYLRKHNVVRKADNHSIRVCQYVTKYVTKSLRYNDLNTRRATAILRSIYSQFERFMPKKLLFNFDRPNTVCEVQFSSDVDDFGRFSLSPLGKELFNSIKRRLDMFHNQSLGFGLSALTNSAAYYIENPYILVPDKDKIVLKVPLSTYYKRKLFQEQVTFNGARFWQRTKIGDTFYHKQRAKLFDHLVKKFTAVKITSKLVFDTTQLVRYMLFHRGKSQGPSDFHVSDVNSTSDILYNYSSPSDVRHYKLAFLSSNWLGSCQTTYTDSEHCYSLEQYINRHAYIDSRYERLIEAIQTAMYHIKVGQIRFERHKERLTDLYKSVFLAAAS